MATLVNIGLLGVYFSAKKGDDGAADQSLTCSNSYIHDRKPEPLNVEEPRHTHAGHVQHG